MEPTGAYSGDLRFCPFSDTVSVWQYPKAVSRPSLSVTVVAHQYQILRMLGSQYSYSMVSKISHGDTLNITQLTLIEFI